MDSHSVHRISSGQVILDVSSAVKELVVKLKTNKQKQTINNLNCKQENSLDAKAKTIEVTVRDFGKEGFQVLDDGTGIDKRNFHLIAKQHCTSKLNSFEDLVTIRSFGFRGEALSSLSNVSELSIVTRTKNDETATKLEFDEVKKNRKENENNE